MSEANHALDGLRYLVSRLDQCRPADPSREAPPVPPELAEAWQAAAEACLAPPPKEGGPKEEALVEQWYVLVTCRDEKHQVELLGRFKADGLTCKAVLT